MPRDYLNDLVSGSMGVDNIPDGAITDSDFVEELFERAFSELPDSDFLYDVYSWWEEKGFITSKQYSAVEKIAEG